MSNKHKKVCRISNDIDHFLILACAITWCISICIFPSSLDVSVGITSSVLGLTICAITAGVKKYKILIQKKKKKHDKTILLAKTNLNTIEVLDFKPLIDSYIVTMNLFQ